MNNYRPVSNLCFISKVLEKVVESQIRKHILVNNLGDLFRSAYSKHHSTETALLNIFNDILQTVDSKQATALLLLDISAAFGTVNHKLLIL